MQWFKHKTNSNRDEKLSEIIDNFGLEGYGLYWMILEIIAEQIDAKSKTSVRYSLKKWKKTVGISTKKFQKTVSFCAEIELFLVKNEKNTIEIDCPNLLKIRDEYTQKKARKSGQCPVSVQKISTLDTETDTDTDTEIKSKKKKLYKEKFDLFWEAYPQRNGRKIGKGNAKKLFWNISEDKLYNVINAAKNYSKDENLHKDPERFLKNNFWNDFVKSREQAKITHLKPKHKQSPGDLLLAKYGLGMPQNALEADKIKAFEDYERMVVNKKAE